MSPLLTGTKRRVYILPPSLRPRHRTRSQNKAAVSAPPSAYERFPFIHCKCGIVQAYPFNVRLTRRVRQASRLLTTGERWTNRLKPIVLSPHADSHGGLSQATINMASTYIHIGDIDKIPDDAPPGMCNGINKKSCCQRGCGSLRQHVSRFAIFAISR